MRASTDGRRYESSGRYWFDQSAAEAAVAFFPTYLRHTEGEWAGKPFVLARWQRHFIRKLFGWKRRDGTRRYRKAWIEIPRKNGKTETAAGLGLLLLVEGERGAQVYSVSGDKDQAKIVFEKATTMVASSEALASDIETFKTSLYCSALNGSFKPLSSRPRTKQGFSPHAMIADEVHIFVDGDLVDAVHEGEGARAQPMEIFITTAGEIGTYAHEQHEYARAVQRREIEDDTLLVVIYAANDNDDWTDPAVWAAANPNLGISPKIEFLRAECQKARNLPRLQNRFRRYYLNQWVEQATRWLPMEFWDCCTVAPEERAAKLFLSDTDRDQQLAAIVRNCGAPDPLLWRKLPEMLAGRACSGGLDLQTTTDIAALSFCFPGSDTERTAFLWRFYLPKETLKRVSKEQANRYQSFADAEALVLTPGNVTDYEFIRRDVLDWAGRFGFGHLAIDRWNATQLAVQLRGTDGLNVEMFGQGFASMSGPSKEFERLVLGLALEHGNHPVMRWMAKNAAVETDAHDNIKPVKPSSGGKTKNQMLAAKMDGIVAAVMGLGMCMAKPAEVSESVYEKIARERKLREAA
ncbi:MAG TPA: terminase TerL endonuclease subunit [Rhizomicrobium sp.]|jgi:phage terminase large subunit-like protein|nr:terminase TerL endonuclease subunit [Rhizomicrobium sp.]